MLVGHEIPGLFLRFWELEQIIKTFYPVEISPSLADEKWPWIVQSLALALIVTCFQDNFNAL